MAEHTATCATESVSLHTGVTEFSEGNAVLKLSPTLEYGGESPDFFAPTDWLRLDDVDLDLGTAGAGTPPSPPPPPPPFSPTPPAAARAPSFHVQGVHVPPPPLQALQRANTVGMPPTV